MNHEHRVFKGFFPSKNVFSCITFVIDQELLESLLAVVFVCVCTAPHHDTTLVAT